MIDSYPLLSLEQINIFFFNNKKKKTTIHCVFSRRNKSSVLRHKIRRFIKESIYASELYKSHIVGILCKIETESYEDIRSIFNIEYIQDFLSQSSLGTVLKQKTNFNQDKK